MDIGKQASHQREIDRQVVPSTTTRNSRSEELRIARWKLVSTPTGTSTKARQDQTASSWRKSLKSIINSNDVDGVLSFWTVLTRVIRPSTHGKGIHAQSLAASAGDRRDLTDHVAMKLYARGLECYIRK